jgi:hypothetical protein
MTDIRNDLILNQEMQNLIARVIDDVSKELMNILKEYIYNFVYLYDYFPNVAYYKPTKKSEKKKQERLWNKPEVQSITWNRTSRGALPTFQFLNSFQWKPMQILIGEVTKELFYNWQSMKYDPNTGLHGSEFFGDLREQLADILNVTGWDEKNIWGGKQRNEFWNNFMNDIFNEGNLKIMFTKSFSKYASRVT